MRLVIRPRLTFHDIYGDLVYCARASPSACRWLFAEPDVLSSRTGYALVPAGRMPVLVARGALRSEGLELLRAAGLEVAPSVHAFGDERDYRVALRALVASGKPLVTVHVHPPEEIPPASLWMSRERLVWLNNKANLPALVDAGHAPRRRLYDTRSLEQALPTLAVPVVLKVATDQSTGGGADVRLCRERADFSAALALFEGAEGVVAEEWLDFDRSLCLNYAVLVDGAVEYLGSAEQICDAEGLYHGNWIDDASAAPASAVALGAGVAARGAALGYRGIVGIDVAILPDERVVAFDLNFRTNGSTAPLLLRDAIARETGKRVMRLAGWSGTGSFEDLLRAGYAALERSMFLPLMTYDPRLDGFDSASPRLGGLLLGESRAEIRAHEREIASLGLK